MKRLLCATALCSLCAAWCRAGPYITVSSGAATVQTNTIGEQTLRRNALGVGYGLTGMFALEVSGFRLADGTDDSGPFPGIHGDTISTEKLSGVAVGAVLRGRLSDWVTVYTKQSYVSLRDEVSGLTRGIDFQYWSHSVATISGWQPAVGLDFRLSRRVPLSLGVEVNQFFASNNNLRNLRSVMLNFSYGF
jgi:hypothetical protein